MSIIPYLQRVSEGRSLDCHQAREAMQMILEGGASQAQIAGFLVALRMKGETAEELVGFAQAMRNMATPVRPQLNGEPLLDTCGTGGDGLSTFNISTIVAFVVAGAGVRVAKHGNRSISSRCGSADLLEQFKVRVALTPAETARCIEEVGIGFLFAPAVHAATRHAQPVRVDLQLRTVFNLLGPLTNPAGATAQLAGAPSAKAAELMATALAALSLERGFVVHGSDGLDEITTSGATIAFEIREGRVIRHDLSPEDFGVPRAELTDLRGGSPETNRDIAAQLLRGVTGPKRDIVLVNASAALVAVGRASGFQDGVRIAAESIDSGAALLKLEKLIEFTSRAA